MHMAQLMPLPLTVSCFSKIQIGFTFLVPAHPGSPGRRAVKWVCVISSIKYSIFANLCQNPHTPVVSTSSLAADSTTEPLYAAHVVPFNTYLLTDCARTLTLPLLTHRWCRPAVWRLIRPQSRCTQRTSYRSTLTYLLTVLERSHYHYSHTGGVNQQSGG